LFEALDFGQNIGFHCSQPLSIRKLIALGEQRCSGRRACFGSKGRGAALNVLYLIYQPLTRVAEMRYVRISG
jgi:hypothetical protein